MTDDIIDHLSFAVCNEGARPAGLIVSAIEEIERLRAERDRWHDIANGLATHIEKASSGNARALQDYDNMVYKEIYGD